MLIDKPDQTRASIRTTGLPKTSRTILSGAPQPDDTPLANHFPPDAPSPPDSSQSKRQSSPAVPNNAPLLAPGQPLP